MLERKLQLSTYLNLRLNNEFKFGPGEEHKPIFAFYNLQEKILICSTKDDVKIPDTYFLGQIGNNLFHEGVVIFDRFSELFKDYDLIPSEKDGRLCIILFNKGKDE